MIPLKDRFEKLIGETFNFVLVNYYPRYAGIGEHSDKGGGMKPNSKVACASVGHTHILSIIMASSGEKLQQIEIPSGSIYSMEGKFQEFLYHSLTPKSPPSKEEARMFGEKGKKLIEFGRFSLTFRNIMNETDYQQGKGKFGKKRVHSSKGIVGKKKKQTKLSPRVSEPGADQ
jgi:hypothetical protein